MNAIDWFNAGNDYFQKGNQQMAIEMWKKTIEANSEFGPAYLNMFETYKGRNDRQNMLKAANCFLDCPVTGRTIDLIPKMRAEIEALTKPPEKK